MWRLLQNRKETIENREEIQYLVKKWNVVLDGRRHCVAEDLFDVRAFMLCQISNDEEKADEIIEMINNNQKLVAETIKFDRGFESFVTD